MKSKKQKAADKILVGAIIENGIGRDIDATLNSRSAAKINPWMLILLQGVWHF